MKKRSLLSKLREKFDFLFNGAALLAYKSGFSPNSLTYLSFLSAIISALSYFQRWILPAAFFILLSGYFDVVDGALARISGKVSKFGSFLDSTLDRASDSIIYCAIILAGLCDLLWGLIALVASLLVSYERAKSESIGITMIGVGIAERAERILILSFFTILYPLWSESISIGITLIAFLSCFTVLQRAYFVYNALISKGIFKQEQGAS